jgi:hypothetical protein
MIKNCLPLYPPEHKVESVESEGYCELGGGGGALASKGLKNGPHNGFPTSELFG